MYSLFIDTHGSKIVLVLFRDGKVLCNETLDTNNRHSVATFPLLKKLFADNSLNVKDLSEVLVVNGPGSFTGVRIAVTIAKTLAYTLNIPIKAIDSLKLLALNVDNGGNEKYVSITDRNGAFIGRFEASNESLGYSYYNNDEFALLSSKNSVFDESDISIDYDKVYEYLKNEESMNPHYVNPLYVKGINVDHGN